MKNLPGVPTLEQLASTKTTSINISLRVKPSTKEFFDLQAQELNEKSNAKITSSSLMNDVLDWYADSHQQQSKQQNVSKVIHHYLPTIAKRFLRTDDESLIMRVFQPNREDISMETFHQCFNNDITLLLEEFRIAKKGEDTNGWVSYKLPISGMDYHLKCSSSAENEVADDADEFEGIINITASVWPIAVAITDAYCRKIAEITHNPDIAIGHNQLPDLEKALNPANDRSKIAKDLVDFFIHHAETMYE